MQTTQGGYFRFLFDPGTRYSLFLVYADVINYFLFLVFMHTQQIFTKNKKNKKREPI